MTRQHLRLSWGSLLLLGGLPLASPADLNQIVLPTPVPLFDQFLALLANPNVAYFLFVLGLLGLVAELATAGTVFPGVLGAICMILALVGLGSLPTNWGGAALIFAGIVMFLLDVKVSGWGLSIGALIAFGLGSLLIFTPPWAAAADTRVRLNPWMIVGTTAGVGAFFLLGVSAAIKAHLIPPVMGRHLLIGRTGTVKHDLQHTGVVHLEGEEWSARVVGEAEIGRGTAVRVIGAEGLTLKVEPIITS